MKGSLPGIILILIIYFVARTLNAYLISHFNIALETLTIGIILGMILNNNSLIELGQKYQTGIKYALKKLLKYGIVLLGFKLNFFDLLSLGDRILILVFGFIPAVLVMSMLLGK